MLKQQWSIEERKEKEAELQKHLLNRERNLELIKHNAAEKALQEQAVLAEKLRDKDLIVEAVSQEQAIEALEHEERMQRRAEVAELQR